MKKWRSKGKKRPKEKKPLVLRKFYHNQTGRSLQVRSFCLTKCLWMRHNSREGGRKRRVRAGKGCGIFWKEINRSSPLLSSPFLQPSHSKCCSLSVLAFLLQLVPLKEFLTSPRGQNWLGQGKHLPAITLKAPFNNFGSLPRGIKKTTFHIRNWQRRKLNLTLLMSYLTTLKSEIWLEFLLLLLPITVFLRARMDSSSPEEITPGMESLELRGFKGFGFFFSFFLWCLNALF